MQRLYEIQIDQIGFRTILSLVKQRNIRDMAKYSDAPAWEDVVPIAQNDGGPNALAAIAYTEEYSEAMSYLRAVMANDEKSDRVLMLTDDIIRMNPAHYTVW